MDWGTDEKRFAEAPIVGHGANGDEDDNLEEDGEGDEGGGVGRRDDGDRAEVDLRRRVRGGGGILEEGVHSSQHRPQHQGLRKSSTWQLQTRE